MVRDWEVSDSVSVVAAFDLDGTLTEGGSALQVAEFGRWPLERLEISRRALPHPFVRRHPLGESADRAKESLLRAVLTGLALDDVTARSRDFAQEHVANKIRPNTLRRLQWHLNEGHRVVVVSASPEIYVSEVARLLGAHGAVGTRLAVDPLGRSTGSDLGFNCRGHREDSPSQRVDCGQRTSRRASCLRLRQFAGRSTHAHRCRLSLRRRQTWTLGRPASLPSP
jgi:HAD superfamily phosphoserine phosphatase-like hydrolase